MRAIPPFTNIHHIKPQTNERQTAKLVVQTYLPTYFGSRGWVRVCVCVVTESNSGLPLNHPTAERTKPPRPQPRAAESGIWPLGWV